MTPALFIKFNKRKRHPRAKNGLLKSHGRLPLTKEFAILSQLKDHDLHQNLILKVQEEKKLLTEILQLLKEVDERNLYSDFCCRSLFDYCVKVLKYSEAEAYTRINAMRLMKEVPEVEKSLEKGELSLTNVAQAQSFFRKEERAKAKPLEKIKIIAKLKNKSTREAKAFLETQASTKTKELDTIKDLPNGKIEIKFSTSDENFKKIEELFARLYDEVSKIKCGARRKSCVNTKSVSPAKRRGVFARDKHKCTNCGSTKNLEVDHIRPQALGGKHELDNLQTLCRNCNQRRAIKIFSLEKMKSFR